MTTADQGGSLELARQVRAGVSEAVAAGVPALAATLARLLDELLRSGFHGLPVPMHVVLDAPAAFDRARSRWEDAVQAHWRCVSQGGLPDAVDRLRDGGDLALLEDAVVEGRILAARLGAAVSQMLAETWSRLQRRVQRLEGRDRLAADDPLRAEVFVRCLLVAWREAGLAQSLWALLQDELQSELIKIYAPAYQAADTALAQAGIPAELDLKAGLRRSAHASPAPAVAVPAGGRPPVSAQAAHDPPNAYRAYPLWQASAAPEAAAGAPAAPATTAGFVPSKQAQQQLWDELQSLLAGLADGGDGEPRATPLVSPALARTLAGEAPEAPLPTDLSMDALARRLRQRASVLKAGAERPSERAVIELVALMFQAILVEPSLPASIKVLFARLQVPVLRVALADAGFFADAGHPVRRLMDRMGGCAMGLDVAVVPLQPLEQEIRRIVRVIEQYPDTGRQVFEAMLRDFEKFLQRWLTEAEPLQQASTLAQRIEQRETLVVQYSIELAQQLRAFPVADAVRSFLFDVWSDVLAVATVRGGAQSGQAQACRAAATALIRATSVQPDRRSRLQMVQQLAALLQQLRQGMRTVGLDAAAQEPHLHVLKEAVLRAHQGEAGRLSAGDLARLAQALDELENVVSDDPEGDLMLDPGVVELLFGEHSAAVVTVIASGGRRPQPPVLAAARQLALGGWYLLDHAGQQRRVQYAWRSPRGQLHLLASGGQAIFLIQTQRLAGYLQAGLLQPVAQQDLTLKVARQALAQLHDDPAQLLS